MRASVGTAVNGGCDTAGGAVAIADVVSVGADGKTGGTAEVVADVGTAAAVEAPAPDIDTRLLELDLLRKG